jgi:hypothetical protein
MDLGSILSGISQYGAIPDQPTINSFPLAKGATGGFGLFGGYNPMQMAGMLGIGQFGAQLAGQEAAGKSGQAGLDTMADLRDIDFGTDLFAANKDIFEQRDMPRFFDKYRATNPFYRQNQLRQNLPDLAGRYGRFGAFVA